MVVNDFTFTIRRFVMATSSSGGSCSSSSGKSPTAATPPGEPKAFVTNTATFNKTLDAIITNLIDEETFSFIVNCGKQVRNGELESLGVFQNTSEEHQVVDVPGLDIFGQPLGKKTNFECVCPKCQRTLAAARFAPHLEKCMGMGRNSSRIASLKNRRLAAGSSSNSIIGASLSSSGRDGSFVHNTNSNSSDGSNDSSALKNGEPFSEDDHFEEDEDDEEWTIEKKKKSKKSHEKVTPKKKGALSRLKNSEARRNKRGISPTISITNSPMSATSSIAMDIANYEELTNDSFSAYV